MAARILAHFGVRSSMLDVRCFSWITYGNGLFVAVGGGSDEAQGLVLTSRDGVNWGITWLSGARLYAVTYADGRFIAVGTRGKGFVSPDGLMWTPMDTGHDASLSGISFGNGKWLVVGGSTLSSVDGANWNVHTNGPAVRKVAYGSGLFVGVSFNLDGAGYNIATSPDGVSWTWRRSGEIERLPGIAHANGQFVAVGPGSIVVSADGTNWTRRN